jgi:stress-induced morphogen
MYQIDIASPTFKGMSLLKQHRMVSQVLEEEIKRMHGIQINTRVS